MKLVFLCSSLEPGRDGVGDYVRQLATACGMAGHSCLLIALNDRHLTAPRTFSHRDNEVRFSSNLSWVRKTAMLSQALREFHPDWVSWQLVPYGFHAKGILPAGIFALADAVRAWPNHVMLHELWLGLARSDGFRARIIGALQRRKLLAFLARLRPSSLNTTNTAYQLALARQGWPAEILPLFGNIPVQLMDPALARTTLEALAGSALPGHPRRVGVIFGTIHPQWKPEPTLTWLKAASREAHKKISLFAVGRPGAHGAKLLEKFSRANLPVSIIPLGARAPEVVSHLLQAADFGIATHPWELLGKSGSTVSLLEHGLPVLVPRDDWKLRSGIVADQRDPLLRRLSDFPPREFENWLRSRRGPAEEVSAIAAKFVSQLSGPAVPGALVA